MPITDDRLPVTNILVRKTGRREAGDTLSPLILSVESVTVAAVVPSYTLSTPVAVTVRPRAVMFAVAVAVVFARL